IEKPSCGVWQVTHARPLVPRLWKNSFVLSILPAIVRLAESPDELRNGPVPSPRDSDDESVRSTDALPQAASAEQPRTDNSVQWIGFMNLLRSPLVSYPSLRNYHAGNRWLYSHLDDIAIRCLSPSCRARRSSWPLRHIGRAVHEFAFVSERA